MKRMPLFYFAIFCLSMISVLEAQIPQAVLLGQWSDSTIVGSQNHNNAYNDVWGLFVNDHEYAVIGSTAGTHIIDVTDPGNVHEAFFVPGAVSGNVVVHRDFKDYKGYLYAVCDQGPSTLQIMDISRLPDTLEVVYDTSSAFNRSHNIFIDSTFGMLYTFSTAGGDEPYSAMRVYSLADPVAPEFIGSYYEFDDISANHFHDGYVRNGIAYLNGGNQGFAMVDFTDPAQPVTLGTMALYPNKGYNHSGWLNETGTHYYMADENHGSPLKVVDVTIPADLEVVNLFDAESAEVNSIPHNQLIKGDLLYVSYYYDGLQVYDISEPTLPVRVAHYPTSSEPNLKQYRGAWGVYPYLPSGNILVSDMQNGLFVFAPIEGTSDLEEDLFIQKELVLTPNPVRDLFSLSGLPTGDHLTIQLIGIDGRIIHTWEQQNTQADRIELTLPAHLAAGLYTLRVLADIYPVSIQLLHIHGQ